MRFLFALLVLLTSSQHIQIYEVPDKEIIFKEFDGISPNGDWRKQYGWEYFPSCEWDRWHFDAGKENGKMYVDGGYGDCPGVGNNQHVVRFDKTIDQHQPYTIECDFIIAPTFESPVNSFCINFNIQKGMTKDSMLNCWAINLDIHDKETGRYTIKNMGFADSIFNEAENRYEHGRFTEMLPSHTGYHAEMFPAVNHFKIEVNKKINGEDAEKWVTVTWSDRRGIRSKFEEDYSKFPYQPLDNLPVKIGLNTHGSNWIVKNMIVYYD